MRQITLGVLRGVVKTSPVDSGRFRGNWQVSVGAPTVGPIERLDKGGDATIAVESQNIGGAGSITWIVNNVPYAEVIEYGGYPNPPKRGTWVRGKLGRLRKDGTRRKNGAGHYEINSAGGYSKQAPAGVVRITMARVQEFVRDSER